MRNHRNRLSPPHGTKPDMNAATVQTAASLSRAIEDKTVKAHGFDSLEKARAFLARETKVSASTFAKLRREQPRLKERAAEWVKSQLADYCVRTLQEEMARLEHELALVRRMAARPDADEILAAEAAVVAARAAVRRIAG